MHSERKITNNLSNGKKIRSSYIKNNYGNVFEIIVYLFEPITIVECGVLDGYSTMHIAYSLKYNREKKGIYSQFFAYDLWDKYDFKHGNISEVFDMLSKKGLDKYVELCYGDAFEVYENYHDFSIDLLHMDISNDGNTLMKTIDIWGKKISKNGIILFEGGSKERDNIDWMKKYDKVPINETLKVMQLHKKGWKYFTLESFPSMIVLIKGE